MRTKTFKDIKKEFLEPSFDYLVQNGLENVSMRDLCRVMGVSTGLIYYWFDNKDDVFINIVQCGLDKIADDLMCFMLDNIHDPKLLFDTLLDEIEKYKLKLRLVFQVCASPIYGDRMRDKMSEFKSVQEKYVAQLADKLDCRIEVLNPIVGATVSALAGYVIWEDYAGAKKQIAHLYDMIVESEFL